MKKERIKTIQLKRMNHSWPKLKTNAGLNQSNKIRNSTKLPQVSDVEGFMNYTIEERSDMSLNERLSDPNINERPASTINPILQSPEKANLISRISNSKSSYLANYIVGKGFLNPI